MILELNILFETIQYRVLTYTLTLFPFLAGSSIALSYKDIVKPLA